MENKTYYVNVLFEEPQAATIMVEADDEHEAQSKVEDILVENGFINIRIHSVSDELPEQSKVTLN